MQAALRRGLQPTSLAACYRSAALPQPWQALRNALSSMTVDADAVPGQQGDAERPSAAAAAAATAARPSTWHQQHASNAAGPPSPVLETQQAMHAALQTGNFAEVLRLLRDSEAAAAAAAARGAAWRPPDRAALYDLALEACALHGDAVQARRLVNSMWKQRVPVGVMANTALLKALCAAGRHAAALDHLRTVPTTRQRTAMFTLLLRSCTDRGALAVGRECYQLFKHRGHIPDARLLAEAIRLHGASGDVAAVEDTWQSALPAAAGKAEVAALHAARTDALARAGELEAAVTALSEMLDAFASLLPVDTSRSLREAAEAEAEAAAAASSSSGAAAGQQVRQVQQAWSARRPAGPVEMMQQARNAVLRAAQERGDGATAQRVASLATLRGLPPDVGTYNTLLRVAMDRGDGLEAVLDGVQEMRRLGLRPNRETYLLLLRGCEAEGDTAAAQAAFDAMPADGVAQTRMLHQALLRAYSSAGDIEGVDAAYRRMQAAGFAPDGATFAALLDCVQHWASLDAGRRAASEEPGISAQNERVHQRQLASVLLERWSAELDAARPSVLTPTLFASLLRAYSQSGQVHTVLLLMWQAFGCQLSPDTAAALGISSSGGSSSKGAARPAAAAGGSGALDALDAAIEEDSSRQASPEASSSSGSSSEGPLSGVMTALPQNSSSNPTSSSSSSSGDAAGREPTAALASSSSGDAAGREPTAALASSSSVDSNSKSEANPSSPPLAAELSSSGSRRGGGSGSGVDGGDNNMEARLLSPLRQSTVDRAQLAPSLPIFNTAIGACTRVGHAHMRDAVALLRSMLAAGLSPDVVTYTSLIAGCAYGRQAALARELLRDMQQRGVQPSAWTHNAMLKVECWTYGPDAGLAMVRRLVGQGLQPDRATWSTLLASAKHARRGDISDLALAELAAFKRRQDDAEAEAARQAAAAAAAEAAAAGRPPPADDHRWHGYYEQQQQEEDEDEW